MTQHDPLISIIIINYNYGRFLCDAINSALSQTYPNTELIVVDDGSTDDSRAIIAGYGSRVIPVYKENGGQASAFNAGFYRSSGEIVCFVDADDVLLPTRVQLIVAKALERKEAVLIYHGFRFADAKLRPFGKTLPLSFLDGDVRDKVLHSGGCWPFPPPAGLAFRRSLLAACMPIPEGLSRSQAESCLAYCAPLLGPVAAISEALCLYRRHDSSDMLRLHQTYLTSMDSYRVNVEGANLVLARIGRAERLQLQDNVGYLKAQYCADVANRPSWAAVSWKIACWSSERSYFVRCKDLVKFWLESLGVRQFSSCGLRSNERIGQSNT